MRLCKNFDSLWYSHWISLNFQDLYWSLQNSEDWMLPSTQTDVFDQMTAPVEHKCPKCKKDQKNKKKPMKKFEEMAHAGFSMFSAMVTAVLSTWNWRPLALYEVPDTIMTQATQIHVLFSDSFHHLFPRFSWFWFNAAKLIFGGRKSAELNYSAWWTKLETEQRVFTTFECNTQKDPKTNEWS